MTEPGPVVLRTLADYQAFTLSALCQACDRSVSLDHQVLADRWGWELLLTEIRQRLRCRRCGRRPKRLLVGYHQAAAPDGEGPSPVTTIAHEQSECQRRLLVEFNVFSELDHTIHLIREEIRKKRAD